MYERIVSGVLLAAQSLLIIAAMLTPNGARAGVLTEAQNTVEYDFEMYSGFGFEPDPVPDPILGQLLNSNHIVARGFSDGDVTFGGTEKTGDFARGPSLGGEQTGGVYAFDVGGGNIALGTQPTATDFNEGSFVFRINNGGAGDITRLTIGFQAYYLNDQNRSNFLTWEDSLDDNTYSDFGTAGTIVSDESAAAQPRWFQAVDHQLTVDFGTGGLTPGSDYFFRFRGGDVAGSGSRDEFAVDNVSFAASYRPNEMVPEPGSAMIWAAMSLLPLIRRRRKPLATSYAHEKSVTIRQA